MKKMSVLSLMLVLSHSAFSMELGDLIIGGTGCFGSTKLVPIQGQEGRYAVPLRVRVNKKSETAFERKSCQIRLPISLAEGEKLQLTDLSQVIRVVSTAGANAKSNLSMGFVGRDSKTLSFEMKANPEEPSKIENLKLTGVVSESACGQDVMLTGNLNILAQGAETQAFISTGTALVTIKVVPCAAE